LVHFLRTLQTTRHSKENEVLKAAGGKIPVKAPDAGSDNKGSGGGQ